MLPICSTQHTCPHHVQDPRLQQGLSSHSSSQTPFTALDQCCFWLHVSSSHHTFSELLMEPRTQGISLTGPEKCASSQESFSLPTALFFYKANLLMSILMAFLFSRTTRLHFTPSFGVGWGHMPRQCGPMSVCLFHKTCPQSVSKLPSLLPAPWRWPQKPCVEDGRAPVSLNPEWLHGP